MRKAVFWKSKIVENGEEKAQKALLEKLLGVK